MIFYFGLMFFKAYNSVVECTAHNGLVVGSTPTKPIIHYYIK